MARRFLYLPVSGLNNNLLPYTSNSNAIVVLGANGSGKTRFGYRIEEVNNESSHRITAQKSLIMPDFVSTKSFVAAELDFYYGSGSSYNVNQTIEWLKTVGKNSNRYANKPNTALLSDFDSLMSLIFTEEFEVSIKFREESRLNQNPPIVISKLDKIIAIWEKLLPHRKIKRTAGSIEALFPINQHSFQAYRGSEMSDGERVIFYLIAAAVSVKQESILIIDEPELHIHKSILKPLFDEIEKIRDDVLFVYLTHDIDFAVSRAGSEKIIIKSYNDNLIWFYDFLPKEGEIPESIYLQILGSRKNILFIEGTKDSLDYAIYTPLFPEFTVQPIGGCNQVIEATKVFNSLNAYHHLEAKGIIDRDRRTDDQVSSIEKHSINVLKVAEIENVYLIENVVRGLAQKYYRNPDTVFSNVKANVISTFQHELEQQVMLHTVHRIKMIFGNALNDDIRSMSDLQNNINGSLDFNYFDNIYQELKEKFKLYIANNDYVSILKVANIKNLVIRSNLANEIGMKTNLIEIKNQVIGIIKDDLPVSSQIREAIKAFIF